MDKPLPNSKWKQGARVKSWFIFYFWECLGWEQPPLEFLQQLFFYLKKNCKNTIYLWVGLKELERGDFVFFNKL